MHGCDYSGFETQAAALLVPCANHLLGLKDGKQRFLDTMVAVAKAYSLCGTLDEVAALRKEIAFPSRPSRRPSPSLANYERTRNDPPKRKTVR